RATGLEGLGAAPSSAEDISSDGTVIVGRAWDEPALFRRDAPISYLGDGSIIGPGQPLFFVLNNPQVVLNDGTVFGGCMQSNGEGPLGCRQDGPATIEPLFSISTVYAADELGN